MKKLLRSLLCLVLLLAGNHLSAQNVSTAIDNNGASIAVGVTDPNWVVVAGPAGAGTTKRIPSFPNAWVLTPIALTNAGWINQSGGLTNTIPGNYTLERSFTISGTITSFTTNLKVAFDDELLSLVLVDPSGGVIPLSYATTPTPLYSLTPVGTYTQLLPATGTWKIRAVLHAVDNFAGFMLSGDIKTTCGPLPCDCDAFNPSFLYTLDTACAGHFSLSGNVPACLQNVAYEWQVNGITVGTGNTLDYYFPGNGTYTICLIATAWTPDGKPCYKEYCKEVKITGCDCKCEDLKPSFLYTLDQQCTGHFSQNGTIPSCLHNVTYNWSVNGTLVGSGLTFDYLFPADGTYNVCLVVTGTMPDGTICSKEYCEHVQIINCKPCKCQDLQPDFSSLFNFNNHCKVFFHALGLVPSCLQNVTYSWYANNVLMGVGTTLNYNFPGDGHYNVCLVVTGTLPNGGACEQQICHDVEIVNCSPCNCSLLQPNFIANVTGCDAALIASGSIPACMIDPTFVWKLNGSIIGTGSTLNYTFPGNGTYDVCLEVVGVINGVECHKKICRKVTITNCTMLAPNKAAPGKGDLLGESVKLYPNPANDVLTVEFRPESAGEVTILLKSIDGRELLRKSVSATASLQRFDLKVPSSVVSSMIFVEIHTSGQRIIRKVEVLRK